MAKGKKWLNSYTVEIAHLLRTEYIFKSKMKAHLLVGIPFGISSWQSASSFEKVTANDIPFGSNRIANIEEMSQIKMK